MDSDEEDFVFYGTPIQREEDVTSRKKKSIAEAAGQLRSVVPWKQEVRDEEGRRRFHGAFTGGFSAGYYNSVGSKEGWTPQTFTSSRKNRAELKAQNILNFLDDDEKAEMEGQSLGTSLQFDTFGFTSAELARKQVDKEQQDRPSAIPGLVPDEIILPVANSIGVKLLRKMGWRHGHSIKDSRTNSLYDARREARKAFLAFSSGDAEPNLAQFEPNKGDHEGVVEPSIDSDVYASQSTPVFVLNPKQDMHGLGYDPFKHAPEFREQKRLRLSGNREPGNRRGSSMKENLFSFKSGKIAPGFGIGALEELDAEDEDVYASGFDFEETHVQEIEEPSRMLLENKKKLGKAQHGVLPGFNVASTSDYHLERYGPPVIPVDFEPYHKFPAPLEIGNKLSGPTPPEVSPPEENNLRLLIEGFATLVARCGKLFEDLSREKNKKNPLFSFLDGGKGHEYYTRKLWEEQQKRNDQTKQQVDMKSMPNVQKMTAESRGKILGERPLERSSKDSSSSVASADVIQLQFNLSDTFTEPASINAFPEAAKPFKADPEKQERFERFLKEKYHGGLRTTDSGGSSNMSEADRAREKLDFEAAAEVIKKGVGQGKLTDLPSNQQFWASLNTQFTSGGVEAKIPQGEEQTINKMYPKREEYQWRPSPLLCKRFDIIDPYMGKPPPLPRAKSRIDSLIFTPDFVEPTKSEERAVASTGSLFVSQSEEPAITEQITSKETAIEPNTTNVERPVDLYKAIFSDDSDDEGEGSTFNRVEDTEKKTEVVNTTLNRLIAGDFLESLGKELGLEVPPEPPITINKVGISASQKETISPSIDVKIPSVSAKPSSTPIAFRQPLTDQETPNANLSRQEFIREKASDRNELKEAAAGDFLNLSLEMASKDKKTKAHSRRDRSGRSAEDERSRRGSRHLRSLSSTSSEEDESPRKRSRRHHSRSSSSDTDSDDHGYRKHSRKSGKKSSSRGKSGSSSISKKHSKHHSLNEESPNRSSRRGSGRAEHTEDRKRSRKSSEREKDYSVSSKSDTHRKYR